MDRLEGDLDGNRHRDALHSSVKRFFSVRHLFLGLFFVGGVWAMVAGANLSWDWQVFELKPPWSDTYAYDVPFDVFRSPDANTIACTGALLAAGVIMVGGSCFLTIKRFSLRLLLAVVLMAAGAGSAPHLLIPVDNVELIGHVNFDAQGPRLEDKRKRLDPADVMSAHPAGLWRRVQIAASDVTVVDWSVRDLGVGLEVRAMLRLAERLEPDQVRTLCYAYAQRIAQMAFESASDETRKCGFSPYWRDDRGPQCVFGHLRDQEIAYWLGFMAQVRMAEMAIEHYREADIPPEVKAGEIELQESMRLRCQAWADEILNISDD